MNHQNTKYDNSLSLDNQHLVIFGVFVFWWPKIIAKFTEFVEFPKNH